MKRSIVCLLVFFAVVLGGCGRMTSSTGDVSEKSYPVKVDNPQVREFNKQLGDINGQAAAACAVNDFVGYVDTKLTNSGTTVESIGTMLGPELIQKLAEKEADARDPSAAGQTEMLDVGIITDGINALGSTKGVRVNDQIVIAAKNAVEGSIPNMNPNGKTGITPLEASIIAYAIISGDDGTASLETVKIPKDKIVEFVNRITD